MLFKVFGGGQIEALSHVRPEKPMMHVKHNRLAMRYCVGPFLMHVNVFAERTS